MTSFRATIAGMPILKDHIGVWEGEYIHLGKDGEIIDRHASHLNCWIPEDGSSDIVQVNTYTWADGRCEEFTFAGFVRDGICYFDTERIVGEMSQVDELSIVLTWRYRSDPHGYLYELIQLSHDRQAKFRTWHWMEHDRLVKRTIISERKVTQ
jgi:hypothetical protein